MKRGKLVADAVNGLDGIRVGKFLPDSLDVGIDTSVGDDLLAIMNPSDEHFTGKDARRITEK